MFRVVSGREPGELLRVVAGPDGSVEKLYWATYPVTRDPRLRRLTPLRPGAAGLHAVPGMRRSPSHRGGAVRTAHRRDGSRAIEAEHGRTMTESPQPGRRSSSPPASRWSRLLGTRDEFLRVVEQAFPTTDIHVRGNEITVTGEPGEVALVERLYDELVTVLRTGQRADRRAVERIGRHAAHRDRASARPTS